MHRIIFILAWSIRPSRELKGKPLKTCPHVIQRKCDANGWKILKMNVTADYIVLTLVVYPRDSAEEVVRRLQKHVRSEMYANEKLSPWERGYLAVAIHPGEGTADAVQSFIERQRERRKR